MPSPLPGLGAPVIDEMADVAMGEANRLAETLQRQMWGMPAEVGLQATSMLLVYLVILVNQKKADALAMIEAISPKLKEMVAVNWQATKAQTVSHLIRPH